MSCIVGEFWVQISAWDFILHSLLFLYPSAHLLTQALAMAATVSSPSTGLEAGDGGGGSGQPSLGRDGRAIAYKICMELGCRRQFVKAEIDIAIHSVRAVLIYRSMTSCKRLCRQARPESILHMDAGAGQIMAIFTAVRLANMGIIVSTAMLTLIGRNGLWQYSLHQ